MYVKTFPNSRSTSGPAMATVGVACALVAGACLDSGVVQCPGGLLCPQGHECRVREFGKSSKTRISICVSPDKIVACNGKPTGAPCQFPGSGPSHRCAQGICDEPWCGDGIDDPGEECEDGNREDHDGCSRSCRVEGFYWTRLGSCASEVSAGSAGPDGYPAPGVYIGNDTVIAPGWPAGQPPVIKHLKLLQSSNAGLVGACIEDKPLGQSSQLPPTRRSHGLAHDERRDNVVMFGGQGGGSGTLTDTWELDLSLNRWTRISTATVPPARKVYKLLYHAAIEQVVLLGGIGGADQAIWQFAGADWKRVAVTGTPVRKDDGFIAVYDRRRKRIVVAGGYNDEDATHNRPDRHRQTWELITTWGWEKRGDLPGTDWCVSAAAAYDRKSGKVILFGGRKDPHPKSGQVTLVKGTWVYDSENGVWRSDTQLPQPPGRHSHTLVSLDEGVLLYGGQDAQGRTLQDRWGGRFGGTCNNGELEKGEVCDGDRFVAGLSRECGGVSIGPEIRYTDGMLRCSKCSLSYADCISAPDKLVPPGEWVTIPRGTFMMGSYWGEPCRDSRISQGKETEHQVTLMHDYELQTTEVTQGQFEWLMGYNPSHFGPSGAGKDCGTNCPVDGVNWHEAASYCNALSKEAGKTSCYTCTGSGKSVACQEADAYKGQQVYSCPGYRLPTEAEWEYAYRAGTITGYYSGRNDGSRCEECWTDINADKIGWYCANSGNTTHPVGRKQKNKWGLYDMAGNVREWCHDWFQEDLGWTTVSDPWGAATGTHRVMRGGSWTDYPLGLRAAWRGSPIRPWFSSIYSGFRCCRTK